MEKKLTERLERVCSFKRGGFPRGKDTAERTKSGRRGETGGLSQGGGVYLSPPREKPAPVLGKKKRKKEKKKDAAGLPTEEKISQGGGPPTKRKYTEKAILPCKGGKKFRPRGGGGNGVTGRHLHTRPR